MQGLGACQPRQPEALPLRVLAGLPPSPEFETRDGAFACVVGHEGFIGLALVWSKCHGRILHEMMAFGRCARPTLRANNATQGARASAFSHGRGYRALALWAMRMV